MSDKRRGRPRLIPDEHAADWHALHRGIHTERQRQNLWLAYQALSILGLLTSRDQPLPAPSWLVDWEGANRGKLGAIKWVVLEELGRMARAGFDPEDIRDWAAALNDPANVLTAKEAAARIRRYRIKETRACTGGGAAHAKEAPTARQAERPERPVSAAIGTAQGQPEHEPSV